MARKKANKGFPKSEAQKTLDFLKTPKAFKKGGSAEKRSDPDEISDDAFYDLLMSVPLVKKEEPVIPLDLAPVAMPATGDFNFSVQTPPAQPPVAEGLGWMPPPPPTLQGRVGYEDGGFRIGASGIASKTPEGVKYMPGMMDVGYRTPMAGGELDVSASRMLEAMPGGKRPFNVQARFTKKFENGGEVYKDDEGYPLPSPDTNPKKWKEFLERYGEIMEEKEKGVYFGGREVFDDGASLLTANRTYPEIIREAAPYVERSDGMSDSLRNKEGMELWNGRVVAPGFNAEEPQYFENGGEASPLYEYNTKISPEKKIANLIGLGSAYDASVQAPKDMGMSGDEGTQGDAVRHMVLMREVSKKYGPVAARALGYGHEFGFGMLKGQSSQAREMDLDNNAVGLRLSKEAGDDEAKFRELMSKALADRTAVYYRNENNKGSAKQMLKEVPRKRAEGSPEMGEVSGRTFEEGGPESARRMLKDVARGVSYYPYDLIGAPVDIINMGLKGVDYVTGSKLATEKPVGGSAYLIDKSNKAGIAEKPTGSAAEELARFSSALTNPASGARATGRVLEKTGKLGKDVLEDLSLATTGQGGSKIAQLVTSQAQPSFVVRPKDQGIVATAGSYTKDPISNVDEYLQSAVRRVDTANVQLTDAQKEAIKRFYDVKARNFFTRQAGTESDPVLRQLMEGKIEPYGRVRDKFPDYLFSGVTTGTTRQLPGGGTQFFPVSTQAIPHFNRFYDEALGLRGTRFSDEPLDYRQTGQLETDLTENLTDALIKKGVPAENINPDIQVKAKDPKTGDWGFRTTTQEKLTAPKPQGISGLLKEDTLPPELRAAREKNEVIYDISSPYSLERELNFFKADDVTHYLSTLTPEQIEKMPFADIIAKASKYNAPRLEFDSVVSKIKEGKPVDSKYFTQGISQPITNYDDGYQWVRVETPEAVRVEGAAMGHSVGGYAGSYGKDLVEKFKTGEHEVWSLRNKKGRPAVTIQLQNNADGTKEIQQVKGNGPKSGNAQGGPVDFDEKVNDLLTNYIKPTYISEGDNYLTPSLRKYKEDLYQKYSNE
jgi:hypothetical protein